MIKKSVVAIAVTAGLLRVAGASHADVKVVSQVKVSKEASSGAAPISRTVTAYFKNNNVRIESGKGSTIFLYDYTAHSISVLNPAQKTYYVKPIPKAGQGNGLEKLNQFVSIKVTGGIQPISRMPSTTIAGVPTKPYGIRADVRIQPKNDVARGFLSEGWVSVHVEGQFQGAAASLVLPAATTERLLSLTQQLLVQGWVPGPLVDDIMELKVVPMKATVVVTPSSNLTAAAQKRGGGRLAGRRSKIAASSLPTGPTTISTEVTSLDENTTLDSALFAVPYGYEKVEPPTGGLRERFGSGLL